MRTIPAKTGNGTPSSLVYPSYLSGIYMDKVTTMKLHIFR